MGEPTHATLQIVGTRITNLNITNDFAAIPPDSECTLALDYEIGEINTIAESASVPDDTIGYVATAVLTVTVECIGGDKSMRIELSTEACFMYRDEDKEAFHKLLQLNGAATLYSIARGQIISITSQCTNGGSIIVPLLNFSEVGSLTQKQS